MQLVAGVTRCDMGSDAGAGADDGHRWTPAAAAVPDAGDDS